MWVPSVNEMRRYFFCLIADGCNCGGRRRETEVTEIVVRGKEPGSGSAPGRNGEGSQHLATYRPNSEDEDMKDVMPPSFPFISINHRVLAESRIKKSRRGLSDFFFFLILSFFQLGKCVSFQFLSVCICFNFLRL